MLNHHVHMLCRNSNPTEFCMKLLETSSNYIQNNSNRKIEKRNIDINRNCKNAINLCGGILKVLCTVKQCLGLRAKHHGFNEGYLACNCNVHRLWMILFSDIKLDKARPIHRNQTDGTRFPNVTLVLTAGKNKKQRD